MKFSKCSMLMKKIAVGTLAFLVAATGMAIIQTGTGTGMCHVGCEMAQANVMNLNAESGANALRGTFTTSNNDKEVAAEFILSNASCIKLSGYVAAKGAQVRIYAYNSEDSWLTPRDLKWDYAEKQYNLDTEVYLTGGTYKLAIAPNSSTGSFEVSVTYAPSDASFEEPIGGSNNSMEAATALELNKPYRFQLSKNDSDDWFRVVIPSNGIMTLTARSNAEFNYYIYDSNGNNAFHWYYSFYDSNTQQATDYQRFSVAKGTYYISMYGDPGIYEMQLGFAQVEESFPGAQSIDNVFAGAREVQAGVTYKGFLPTGDGKDIYKIILAGKTTLNFVNDFDEYQGVTLRIYDEDGNNKYWNYTESKKLTSNIDLPAGTYYLSIESSNDGTYAFSLDGDGIDTSILTPAPKATELPYVSQPNPTQEAKLFWNTHESKTGILEGGSGAEVATGGTIKVTAESGGEAWFTILTKGSETARSLDSLGGTNYAGTVRVDLYPVGDNGIVYLDALCYNGLYYKITQVKRSVFTGSRVVRSLRMNNVTSIAAGAFQNCVNLKSVALGSSLSSLGKRAFSGCKSLKTVKITSTRLKASTLGKLAFQKTPKKAIFKLAKSKLKAYKKIFVKKCGASKKAKFKKA